METIRTRRGRLGSGLALAAAGMIVLALAAGAAGSTATSQRAAAHDSATAHESRLAGGTATFALPAQGVPNYIFPFMSLAFFSVVNISDLQQLMYRPLYWFGTGGEPTLNPSLSLAAPPVYSKGGTVATLHLKPYKWSNGETVTAQDVVFWMNMLKVEYPNWAAYAPGTMPDDVKSVVAANPTTVTITLTGAVNSNWFTYNELSQITPFPLAWDVSKPGQAAGGEACAKAPYASVTVHTVKSTVTPVSAAARSCVAVYTYLSRASGFDPANPKAPNNALAGYATNPLWQVVDGPWHLTSFNPDGNLTMKPNPTYSGPVKPSLDEFVELPFTSNSAEFNALVGGKVTVGYIPYEDITSPAKSPTVPGENNARVASKFDISPWYPWGINFFPYNFKSSGAGGQAGRIFSQLYVRQALQTLVDQPLYIEKIFKNYAVPTYGPVPVLPKNTFATAFEQKNPYAYDVARATSLLTSHGWKVDPKGVTTCIDAARCGVPAGTPLSFTLQYVNNSTAEQELMQAQVASWQQAGIKVTLTTASFDTVIGNAVPCSGKSCTWELENWGGGWVYAPDFYPSGEEIFQTGAGSNSGSYTSAADDRLIKETNFGDASLAGYENYLTSNLPVVWQPNQAYQVTEYANNLHGATPQNALLAINPENWYFTK